VDIIVQDSALLLGSSKNKASFHALRDFCPLIQFFYIKIQYLSVRTEN